MIKNNVSETRIRPALDADLDAMCELLYELFSIETDFISDSGKQRRGLAMLLKQNDAMVLAAEDQGQVIGMCSVQTLISSSEGNRSGLLEDLIVKQEYRGKGIGKLLLDEAENWARSKGMTRLQLLADQRNEPALSFYEHLGWDRTNMICLRRFPA